MGGFLRLHKKFKRVGIFSVSVPSRGLRGFLPDEGPHRERLDVVFPSPLDGWVVSYDRGFTTNVIE